MRIYRLLAACAILGTMLGAARAGDLSQLKTELDNLNSAVSTLELAATQPALFDAGNLLFLPANGRPAAASIKWQGYVRAIVGTIGRHEGFDGDQSHTDHPELYEIPFRTQLEAVAKSGTDAGEVGTRLKLRADYSLVSGSTRQLPAAPRFKEAWGWWTLAKHWTIAGGYTNSLGNMDFGLDNDGSCTCYYTNKGNASDLRQNDAQQLRLTRTDGPLSLAVAIQSALAEDKFGNQFGADPAQVAFASALQWAGKGFDSGAFGYYAPLRQGLLGAKPEYQFGVGFGADLTKSVALSLGTAAGRENIFVTDCDPSSATFEPARYYAVSGLVTIKLTDAVHAEVGYARKYYRQSCHTYKPAQDAAAGLYYEPVRNLTLGVEGEWIPFNGGPTDAFIPAESHGETRVAFVSKFRF